MSLCVGGVRTLRSAGRCDEQTLSADEERVLVEMACGAALAAVYSGVVKRLQGEGNCRPDGRAEVCGITATRGRQLGLDC